MSSVFSLLNPKIQKLLNSKDILEPTEQQKKAIPPILDGENVLLISPTGLGKAYLLRIEEMGVNPHMIQLKRNLIF